MTHGPGHIFPHIKTPPTFGSFHDVLSWCRQLYQAFLAVRKGKLECTSEVTLTPNAATTQVTIPGVLSQYSFMDFDPLTANAAAEKAAGTMYVLEADRGTDTWTITHANNGQTDREFLVVVIG